MKRKTHEQFIEELRIKNNLIEVLGTYKNSQEKILCKCKICGFEWEVIPNNLLRGRSCPNCAKEIRANKKRKDINHLKNEINKINPNIKIIGKYINNHTKIKCKCNIDGYEWLMTPTSLLKGRNCPECSNKKYRTDKEFKAEISKINKDIEILGDFVNTTTKIKCKCKICNHQWSVKPYSLLIGYGCPKCAKKKLAEKNTRTNEEFIEDISIIAPHIKILGKYTSCNDRIKVKCSICGYEWNPVAATLYKLKKCPNCSGTRKKTHDEFIDELYKINKNITVLEKYDGIHKKIKCSCNICNNIWTVEPNSLLQGTGCPNCGTKSHGEEKIRKFLIENKINFEQQYKNKNLKGIGKKSLSYDFYLPDYNLFIEYQGIQHYKPIDFFGGEKSFKNQQKNDELKRMYAKKNSIELLEISYIDFNNIEQILCNKIFKQSA